MTELIHESLTYQIRAALFAVYNALGPGFREETYRQALRLALKDRNLVFETEKEITILFDGHKVDNYRLDFVVEEKVLLELKAVETLHPRHDAQPLSYLKASRLAVGLLVNFGEERLVVRRRVLESSAPSMKFLRNPRTHPTG